MKRGLAFALLLTALLLVPLAAAHLHRAAAGVNGPVIYPRATAPFAPPPTNECDFDPADLGDLMGGHFYANVHTSAHPSGEARGQVEPGDLRGMTVAFHQPMSPENEVPPHPDLDAGAQSAVILDLKLMGNRVVAGSATFEVDYRFAADDSGARAMTGA